MVRLMVRLMRLTMMITLMIVSLRMELCGSIGLKLNTMVRLRIVIRVMKVIEIMLMYISLDEMICSSI